MNWPSQRFEPTDSEHNFILLSERFNLTRVTLSMCAIASTEALSDLGIYQILPRWLVQDANAEEYAKYGNGLPRSAKNRDCRDAPCPDTLCPDTLCPVASLPDGGARVGPSE